MVDTALVSVRDLIIELAGAEDAARRIRTAMVGGSSDPTLAQELARLRTREAQIVHALHAARA